MNIFLIISIKSFKIKMDYDLYSVCIYFRNQGVDTRIKKIFEPWQTLDTKFYRYKIPETSEIRELVLETFYEMCSGLIPCVEVKIRKHKTLSETTSEATMMGGKYITMTNCVIIKPKPQQDKVLTNYSQVGFNIMPPNVTYELVEIGDGSVFNEDFITHAKRHIEDFKTGKI